MKKLFRMTALLLAAVLLTFVLCSCQALDEAKASQAVISNNNSEIRYGGYTYHRMRSMDFDVLNSGGETIEITDEDVPVLLAGMYGRMGILSRNKIFITCYSLYDSDDTSYISHAFVREDMADKVNAITELDHYYFEYSEWDPEDFEDKYINIEELGDYARYVQVDDTLCEAVNQSKTASAKEKIKYTQLDENDLCSIDLLPCDADMLLTDSYSASNMTLVRCRDQYYVWNGTPTEKPCFYLLKGDAAASAKSIFDNYPDAVESNSILWKFNGVEEDSLEYEDVPER